MKVTKDGNWNEDADMDRNEIDYVRNKTGMTEART